MKLMKYLPLAVPPNEKVRGADELEAIITNELDITAERLASFQHELSEKHIGNFVGPILEYRIWEHCDAIYSFYWTTPLGKMPMHNAVFP